MSHKMLVLVKVSDFFFARQNCNLLSADDSCFDEDGDGESRQTVDDDFVVCGVFGVFSADDMSVF